MTPGRHDAETSSTSIHIDDVGLILMWIHINDVGSTFGLNLVIIVVIIVAAAVADTAAAAAAAVALSASATPAAFV